MTKHTRKSLTNSLILATVVLLLSVVLALQFISAPVFFNAPGSGVASAQTSNGVKVTYTDVPNGLAQDNYELNDTSITSSAGYKPTPKPDEKVSVVISLSGTPMMQYSSARGITISEAVNSYDGRKNLSELTAIRDKAMNELAQYITDVNFSYSSIMNGFSATIKYGDLAKIESNRNVKNVILSDTYLAPKAITENKVDVYSTGIFDSTGVGYDGTGTVVAVVDTGTDYNHEVFDMSLDPATLALTKDDVAAVLPYLAAVSLSAAKQDIIDEDNLYLTTKLPYAYDYADSDTDVYPKEAHGTHVAGIIGGCSEKITGVAPGAQIATFKVFSDFAQGAPSEAILAALNDAVWLQVDAINMSLGSSCGFTREVDEEYTNEIYDAINAAGICLVVAASNDASSAQSSTWGNTNLASNPDSGTVGSPASYDASLAVASISGVKTKYFSVDGQEVYFGESRYVGKTDSNDFVAELLQDREEGEFEYVVVPGMGYAFNYLGGVDVNGKIAVISRGGNSFEEKVNVAKDNGAIGAIIYNNVSGTISMSVGTKPTIPSCFVSMEYREPLIANDKQSGTIKLSKSFLAGPFMSDFSSWGCLPDLTLSPDITAHGGEITSSYPGGDKYDTISGTSMASPNLCGALVLICQYVKEHNPTYTSQQVRDEAYSRMMSTATIVRNEEGNPYSPRKQGAGLANIAGSIATKAFLKVEDSNKPKLSLGDDPERTGEYTLTYSLVNVSGNAVSYTIVPQVMTESMSVDGKTVAEKAYLFNDTVNTYSVKQNRGIAILKNNIISLSGYGEAEITVKIKLSDSDKKYLDSTFVNGMFLEGFVRMYSSDVDGVDLSIPYMAFYGDWRDAPMLDKTAYEVGESAADDSVLAEDKVLADVYGTLPYSGFASETASDGMAYYGMGAFAYLVAPGYATPETQEKYAALTNNPDGDFMLYMISAGLLRGAKRVDMEIRNSATGELIWKDVDYNARKTHASGQQVGGSVMVELDIRPLNLPNNSTYTFTMTCYLDWKDEHGEYTYGNRNTFSFEFTVDDEAPQLSDLAVRKEMSGDSARYYLDITAYDNHYIQGYTLSTCDGISASGGLENGISISNGMIPANSEFNSDTVMSIEITPYWKDITERNKQLYISFIDYAKNERAYLTSISVEEDLRIEKRRNASETYSLVPNGQVDLKDYITVRANTLDDVAESDKSYAENYWTKDLIWESSDKGVVVVQDGLITGVAAGNATITVRTDEGATDAQHCITFNVVVAGAATEIKISGIELSTGIKADDFGEPTEFVRADALSLERGETIRLYASIKPYNYTGVLGTDYQFQWAVTSANVQITPAEDGSYVDVKALRSGNATVRCTVVGSRVSGYCSVNVKEEYIINDSLYLRSYVGRGDENGVVDIPDDLGIVYIYPGAFYFNEYITEVRIPAGVTTIMNNAFTWCSELKKVVLPETVETLEDAAFAECEKLEEINLEHVMTIGNSCFYGCDKLNNLNLDSCTYIDSLAFAYCYGLTHLELQKVGIVGGAAFLGCRGLTEIDIPEYVSMGSVEGTNGVPIGVFTACSNLKRVTVRSKSIGDGAFYSCTKLESITFVNDVDTIGKYAFLLCTSLKNVTFNRTVYKIDDYAFAYCSGLTSIKLPAGLSILGDRTFLLCNNLTTVTISSGAMLTEVRSALFASDTLTNLTAFVVEDGNKYLSSRDGVLYDRAQKRLILYPASKRVASFTVPDGVTTIGKGAFSGALVLTSVNLNGVEYIEEDGFSYTGITTYTNYTNLKRIGDGAFYASNISMLPITDKTVYIGEYAFSDCDRLTGNVVIPAGVKTLGAYAFAGSNITGVSFENSTLKTPGEFAFYQCPNLATVNLGALTSISMGMFSECNALTEIVIPDTVVSIGFGAFSDCRALGSVTLPMSPDGAKEKFTTVGAYAFAGTAITSITFPNNVTTIAPYAFSNTPLATVNLNKVTSVEAGAFMNTDITIVGSDVLITIGDNAFNGCSNITTVTLPKLTSVGAEAFSGCGLLKTVNAPELTDVGNAAFKDCPVLDTVTFGKISKIGKEAFKGDVALGAIALNTVTSIGKEAFSDTAVTKITLPVSVEHIDDGAFLGASLLTEIVIPEGNSVYESYDGVLYSKNSQDLYTLIGYPAAKTGESYEVLARTIKIGAYAFNRNMNLKTLTFRAYVRIIGVSAMSGMTNLTTIYIDAVSVPVLESEAHIERLTSETAPTDSEEPTEGDDEPGVDFKDKYQEVNSINSDYAFVNVYDNFNYTMGDKDHPTLNIVVASNATGYNNKVWKAYIGNVEVSKSLHVAEGTLNYIERIKNLPANPTSADAAEIASLVQLYNIFNTAQRKFISGDYNYTDSNGNSIDMELYTKILGGTDYHAMLLQKQSNMTRGIQSAVQAELGASVITSATSDIDWIAALGVAVGVTTLAVIIATVAVVKRRGR